MKNSVNKTPSQVIDLSLCQVLSELHKAKLMLQSYKPESIFLEEFLMSAEDILDTAKSVHGQLLMLWEKEKVNGK